MKVQSLLSLAAIAALITSASASITMDWVTVGNPGNAADPLNTRYGSVGYSYKIGKYEVTNAQYGEFLNAKGQSNANGIYNASMSSYGITQSGSSGSYSYNVTGALANRPVVFVSWFDAARFANWMMNGQGSGDMEDGAYTLNGATSGIITANIGAQVYIPSGDEWYKAAYYNATNSTYSLYAHGQNTISTAYANYDLSGSTTNVGTYNASPYGTFDQAGNVVEWTDEVDVGTETQRITRGGSYFSDAEQKLSSLWRTEDFPQAEFMYIGFRVASVVPEPSSMLLSMFAGAMMLVRRKR